MILTWPDLNAVVATAITTMRDVLPGAMAHRRHEVARTPLVFNSLNLADVYTAPGGKYQPGTGNAHVNSAIKPIPELDENDCVIFQSKSPSFQRLRIHF